MHTLITILSHELVEWSKGRRAAMCHRCWMAMIGVGKRSHCGRCFCCKPT